MNKEEQKAFEKKMWDKYQIKLKFREGEDDFISNYRNSEEFKQKMNEVNKLLSRVRFPEKLSNQIN